MIQFSNDPNIGPWSRFVFWFAIINTLATMGFTGLIDDTGAVRSMGGSFICRDSESALSQHRCIRYVEALNALAAAGSILRAPGQ